MESGFDVLIEKPLSLSSRDDMEIIQCQKNTGRKAGVIHNWLFEPPILKTQEILDRDKIGEINYAHISILHPKEEPMTANRDHCSHKLPGGRFSEMMFHPIYLLRRFIGKIELESLNVSIKGPILG